MSDTPRSDLEASDGWSGDAICVSADFARQIERELNAQYEENVARIAAQGKAELDRDRWKAMAEELASDIKSRRGGIFSIALTKFNQLKSQTP